MIMIMLFAIMHATSVLTMACMFWLRQTLIMEPAIDGGHGFGILYTTGKKTGNT